MTSIESLPSDDLHQKGILQEFLAGDDGPWTTVYRGGDPTLYAGFAPLSSVAALLRSCDWEIHISQGGPSLWRDSDGEAHYDCSFGDHGVRPVAIIQEHSGALPRMLPQVLQEFCLFHNLWHADSMTFKKMLGDGTEEIACEVSDGFVRIRTKLLRQFQAAAQVVLVRYIDSTVREGETMGCDSTALKLEFSGSDHLLRLLVREDKRTDDKFSSVMGKKLILPTPIAEFGRSPFNGDEDAVYQEFVIGETPEGDKITSTCDPESLDTMDYLTPVFFSPEVLDRYYSNLTKYEVQDGYLACRGLWGLRLDNNHSDHVMVWLGDLGRDLPKREQLHWLAHNIFVPEGTISQTAFGRHFEGQWAEADSPALRLQETYKRFRDAWAAKWGWDLFRDPDDDDPQLLAGLRIPPRNGDAEFGDQVQALHRLLVESINTSQLKSELPKGKKGERSIDLLQRWLDDNGHQRLEQDIGFLKKIKDLRNVSQHRSGSRHAKAIEKHQIGDDRPKAVSALFEEAIYLLDSLGTVQAGGNA